MKINNRNGNVIAESSKTTIRNTLEELVSTKAYLRGAKGLDFQIVRIQESRDDITRYAKNMIAIGCIKKTIQEWLSEYEKVGKEHNYSDAQIAEYGRYIRMIAEQSESEAK